jgi:hypothetical protein
MPIMLIYLVLWSRAHCSERDLIEPVRVLDLVPLRCLHEVEMFK